MKSALDDASLRRGLAAQVADVAALIGGGRADARLAAIRRRQTVRGSEAVRRGAEAAAFDELYGGERGDPWGVARRTRGYQAWKYDVLLAQLPQGVWFQNALDVGCGTGLLSRRLAERCTAICCLDISETALVHARVRLSGKQATFVAGGLESFLEGAPAACFDLVVVADTFYYLPAAALQTRALNALAWRMRGLMTPGGHLLIANHNMAVPVDHASRVARRVHTAFDRSGAFATVSETRRSFFIVSVFRALDEAPAIPTDAAPPCR